jgi:hypothetical protein
MFRKSSPLIAIFDGDKLVGLEINAPTATCSQPSVGELELVRIFKEYQQLQSDLTEANKEIERLNKRLTCRGCNNPIEYDYCSRCRDLLER